MTARLTALLTVIAAALLAWQWTTVKEVAKQPLAESQMPDYQSQAVVTMIYDEHGKPHYRLAAAGTQHYTTTRITDFDQPSLQLFNEHSEIGWVIRANQAKLVQRDKLYLSGNIEVRSLIAGSTLQKIVAQQVQINLLDQAIRSDQAVTLYGLHFTSSGNSMRGNLNQRQITLLNQVETQYAPSSSR